MFWRQTLSFACAAVLILGIAIAAEPAQPARLRCEVGPVTKTYGTTGWLVYSCDDGRSVVMVSAPGSPAMPFVFTFTFQAGAFRLHGQGTGDKEATAAAFNELKGLTATDIARLVEETKLAKK